MACLSASYFFLLRHWHLVPVSICQMGCRSQHGAMVDKAYLLDYATHEVPLPLFGLDMHLPWSASTPLWAGMSSKVRFVRRLYPNSALAMSGQAPPWTSWVFSLTDSRLASRGFALLPLHLPCASTFKDSCRSTIQMYQYSWRTQSCLLFFCALNKTNTQLDLWVPNTMQLCQCWSPSARTPNVLLLLCELIRPTSIEFISLRSNTTTDIPPLDTICLYHSSFPDRM